MLELSLLPYERPRRAQNAPIPGTEPKAHDSGNSTEKEPERCSSGLYDKPDGGPLLTVDLDLSKGWNADQIDPVWSHKSSADRDGFDGLIDGTGANGLYLRGTVLPQDGCQCAGNSLGLG